MNEHELCCGTVADKAKLCAEIAARDRTIAVQQRRIDELLQERDAAISKQVICAAGCKERGALREALDQVERLREIVVSYYTTGVCFSDVKNIIAETQPIAPAELNAQWQADVKIHRDDIGKKK